MDPAGVRMATGSYDYSMRLWDFGGMDQAHRSFRSLEPQEGNAVVAVSYSPTGDRLVAATGSSKLRVYDRNALPLLTTIKGDPYILDVSNTKGHLTGVSDAHWHPREKQVRGPRQPAAACALTCWGCRDARSSCPAPLTAACGCGT